jgi:hypothetical protein
VHVLLACVALVADTAFSRTCGAHPILQTGSIRFVHYGPDGKLMHNMTLGKERDRRTPRPFLDSNVACFQHVPTIAYTNSMHQKWAVLCGWCRCTGVLGTMWGCTFCGSITHTSPCCVGSNLPPAVLEATPLGMLGSKPPALLGTTPPCSVVNNPPPQFWKQRPRQCWEQPPCCVGNNASLQVAWKHCEDLRRWAAMSLCTPVECYCGYDGND